MKMSEREILELIEFHATQIKNWNGGAFAGKSKDDLLGHVLRLQGLIKSLPKRSDYLRDG